MSKQEFLSNVRIGRNLFAHPRVETDAPNGSPRTLEEMISRAAIWLTPKTVKGFLPADFPELGSARQRELEAAVREFLAVANVVPPDQPASGEQFKKAQTAFKKILTILEPYLGTPSEGEQVETAIENVEFPPWIVNWDYELGSDETGGAAVWLNLFADESRAPRRDFGRFATNVTSQIHEALTSAGSMRWPYVRIRTAQEHKSA